MSILRNFWRSFSAQMAKGWIFIQEVAHWNSSLVATWKNWSAELFGVFALENLGGRHAEAAEIEKASGLELLASLHTLEIAERMQTCRSLRHEFMNHLQVIYGLVQTDKAESIPEYIQKISRGTTEQDILKCVGEALFAQMLHVFINAAHPFSLNLSVSVLKEQMWSGFSDHPEERVLWMRILLFNILGGLLDYPEDRRSIELIISTSRNSDNLEISFPEINKKKIFALPADVKQMLGWDDDTDLQQIWIEVLGGQLILEDIPEMKSRITLISPYKAD